MAPRTPRRFTILDGMILVAAVAGGYALRRLADDAIVAHGFNNVHFQQGSSLDRVIEEMYPFLVTLTPAVLGMRLRRPRPRWRRLARQPGMAACCAAILPIARSLIDLYKMAKFMDHPEGYLPAGVTLRITYGYFIALPPLGEIYGVYGSVVGLWVLGAWLILALSGRRRPEPSWIDRLGRIVGIGWLSILGIKALEFLFGRWLMG
jgi:hypothetical protein